VDRTFGRIYNFDISGAVVKEEHRQWLDRNVVPFLKDGGSVALEGFASATGSVMDDKFLSEDRLKNVEDYLRRQAPGPWKVSSRTADGMKEALKETHQWKEDEFWRAVNILTWSRPTPPVHPVEPPKEVTRVSRITERKFEQLSSTRGRSNSAPTKLDTLPALLDALKKGGKVLISDDEDGEDTTKRIRNQVPVDFEVATINIEETFETILGLNDEESTFRSRVVSYGWGRPQPQVFVATHLSWRSRMAGFSNGGRGSIIAQGDKSSSQFVSRADARESPFFTPRD